VDTKDIIAKVNGKIYKLNSNILFISEVIRQIFTETRFVESQNDVKEIYDVEIKTWELFLNYIYSRYIEKYLNYFTDMNIQTLNLYEVDGYDIIDLLIFADRIISRKIVNIISHKLFKIYLNNLDDVNNYEMYDDILANMNTSVIDFKNKEIFNFKPSYNVNVHKWNFDFNQFQSYPHLLYYILVYFSYNNSNDSYNDSVIPNFSIELGNYTYNRLDIDSLNDVLNNFSVYYGTTVSHLFDNIDIKYYSYRYNRDDNIVILYSYFIYDILNKDNIGDILVNNILFQNWRINNDELVHELLTHYQVLKQ